MHAARAATRDKRRGLRSVSQSIAIAAPSRLVPQQALTLTQTPRRPMTDTSAIFMNTT